jgi:hypothetical protein
MKKTAQTLLTAAMFVSALGSSAAGNSGMQCAAAKTPLSEQDPYYSEVPQPVYGPPILTTTDETEMTTTRTTTIMTTTMMPLYGPPRVFYPTGDVTMDNKVDVRDFTRMKQIALGQIKYPGYAETDIGDLNFDGNVDKEDVEKMLHEVLGVPVKEDPAMTTSTALTLATTTTTATTMMVSTLYGPPSIFGTTVPESEAVTEMTTTLTTHMETLYGPPRAYGADQAAGQKKSAWRKTTATTSTQSVKDDASGKKTK